MEVGGTSGPTMPMAQRAWMFVAPGLLVAGGVLAFFDGLVSWTQRITPAKGLVFLVGIGLVLVLVELLVRRMRPRWVLAEGGPAVKLVSLRLRLAGTFFGATFLCTAPVWFPILFPERPTPAVTTASPPNRHPPPVAAASVPAAPVAPVGATPPAATAALDRAGAAKPEAPLGRRPGGADEGEVWVVPALRRHPEGAVAVAR